MGDTPANTATDPTAEGCMSIADAVAFSGVSKAALYRLMSEGQLVYAQVGRRRLVSRQSLRAWLAARVVPPPAARPEGCPHGD